MKANTRFLKNTWYVAALSNELDSEQLFRRKILGVSVLLYRKENGEVAGLQDRCPHRFAPLSLGRREGDDITCLYHGLKFNSSGECTHSPHGTGKIPGAACVKRFPIVEKDGFIWIWPGDPLKADPEKILIDTGVLSSHPETAVAYTYMHNKCNYELLTDNIMDLTHIDHLHGPFINTQGKLSPLMPDVKEEGDCLRVRWEWDMQPAIPLFSMNQANPDEPSNLFLEVNWFPPSCMTLDIGAVQGGSSDFFADGQVLEDYHIMTPETEFTSHYFFASTRNYKLDDGEYNRIKMEGMTQAFLGEDKPVIEAQQEEMGEEEFWSLKPVLLTSDAAGIRVRRKLNELLEAEHA